LAAGAGRLERAVLDVEGRAGSPVRGALAQIEGAIREPLAVVPKGSPGYGSHKRAPNRAESTTHDRRPAREDDSRPHHVARRGGGYFTSM